jgi:DNA gyrase/topoisomerase IV subunit A
LRYQLVDGRAISASHRRRPPGGYRNTECRDDRPHREQLADIDKETVRFRRQQWATARNRSRWSSPTRVPNLLINGSAGIAVGPRPPTFRRTNLGEVVGACNRPHRRPESLHCPR